MSDKYLLISTDTHAGLPPEQYREYIDPKYREAFDEAQAADVTAAALVAEDDHQRFLAEWNSEIGDHGGMEGAWDPAVRTKEMDAEGVAAEVVFPDADAAGVGGVSGSPFGSGLNSSGDSDPVLVMAGAQAHNRWAAEFCQNDPERRYGIAIVPALHDVAAAVAEAEWAAENGLRGGIMIPTKWGSYPAYNDPVYDPLWSVCAEAGLVVHTHSGVGPTDYTWAPGFLAIYATEAYWWAARPLWALLLGGVFERHPKLRYALAENGAWWVPDILTRMDAKWEGDHSTRKFGPKTFRDGMTMKPSEYYHRNVWMASSVMGRVEVERRHEIGVERLMWGHDYPHPEGTWPHTREWLRDRFADVPEADTRRILGLNAAELYRFDLARLAPVVDRIGLTVEDVHGPAGAAA
ncbi:amidohydrolase family protein [Pseudofrankia asymbiotica]|uniref:Amidohydrolase n=1 Tax=Pseudofrankia asymbiotica TaxID=1834516 RepID=A0A1V2IGX5_9ACTN|nr:amidohydrolase family protein [Pseudofrankia asymbiotica]ONH32448.1 amidohydrolase [Pseudofrankia asymbiotica]